MQRMQLLAEKSRLGQKVVVRRMRRRRNNLSRGLRWRNRKRSRQSSYSRVHYNYFRTYDPAIGKYFESDPIGLGGGLNTYGYAYQSPLDLIDPLGLNPGINQLVKCLAKSTAGACLRQFAITEGKREIEDVKECGICVAKCAVESFIGLDPESIIIRASGEYARFKIELIARETVGKAGAKAITKALSGVGNALSAGQTLVCSLSCD